MAMSNNAPFRVQFYLTTAYHCIQGAFLKKRGAFFGESGAFLKAGCIFPRVGCISEKQGAFWEDKVHCYYLFLKESQIESHL